MTTRIKVVIVLAIFGVVLIVASVGGTPIIKTFWAFIVLTVQYLFTNLGKIITSPACYGLIGFLILLALYGYLSYSQKQQRREKQKQEHDARLAEILPKPSPLQVINKKLESIQLAITPRPKVKSKKSTYPYGVPTEKYEDWARWKRTYGIIKPMTTEAKSWDDIKAYIETNYHGELPSSFETLRNILNAGNDGLLDEFPPIIKTPI